MIVGYLLMYLANASTALVRACGTWEREDRNDSIAYRVAVSTDVMKYLFRMVESGLIGLQTSEEMRCPFAVCGVFFCVVWPAFCCRCTLSRLFVVGFAVASVACLVSCRALPLLLWCAASGARA